MAYVFESGDEGAGQLSVTVAALSEARKRSLQIQSFAYGDKRKCIQLQAADVMAYETAKAGRGISVRIAERIERVCAHSATPCLRRATCSTKKLSTRGFQRATTRSATYNEAS